MPAVPDFCRIDRTPHVMKGRDTIMQGGGVRMLLTAGAGFNGSAPCRSLASGTDDRAVNVNKLTYTGNIDFPRPVRGIGFSKA
jgi:hypothetical protein